MQTLGMLFFSTVFVFFVERVLKLIFDRDKSNKRK